MWLYGPIGLDLCSLQSPVLEVFMAIWCWLC
jgi:hypothetical protein